MQMGNDDNKRKISKDGNKYGLNKFRIPDNKQILNE